MEKAELKKILEFAVTLGSEMLISGANIERVNFTMSKICTSYSLTDLSINSLDTTITLSAKSPEGEASTSHIAVPSRGIDLERLRTLNKLSYKVCAELPAPADLGELLPKKGDTPLYPWYLTLAGYVLALLCLCRIFGGAWQDLIVSCLNTAILFFGSLAVKKVSINKIIPDFLLMFITTSLSLFFGYIGFSHNYFYVIITCAFYLIPGIPMVNAVRNILCENEMNGIIGLIKVFLEVIALVAGLASSFFFFGGWVNVELEETVIAVAPDFLLDVELVALSFLASVGFGIVFNISPKRLVFAGLGGAVIRIVYILIMLFTSYRIVFATVSAFSAALYAEIFAMARKDPSTLYLYPSVIPLIPGDLLYYLSLGIVWSKPEFFQTNAIDCILQLMGISVGFVLCSTVVHYFKKLRLRKQLLSSSGK